MRKNVGWQDKQPDAKYEIRVSFEGGDRIRWQRNARHLDGWEPFSPTADHWQTLVEKVRVRYQRRQAPYKTLQLVQRLAAPHAPCTPSPP